MGSPPELLQYFLAESGEYLDGLDKLVSNPGSVPDASAFVATSRALRGSATMARASGIADVAFAIEQVANALRDGDLAWTPALSSALHSVVTTLRPLTRVVEQWTPHEQSQVLRCLADLRPFLPSAPAPRRLTPTGSTTPVFIALQASAIASDLDAFIRDTVNTRALDDILTRVRIMRGIAGISDVPPLADVCDAVERASRRLVPDAPLSPQEAELFRAAAAVLRRASDEMRTRGRPNPGSSDVQRFAAAVAAVETPHAPPERLVRIDELFYADGGPHVVRRPPVAPGTLERRFHDEIVSRAEHVRRLIADLRASTDIVARDRASRDLSSTLRALEVTAQSFGAAQVAAFCGDAARESGSLNPATLDALDAAALLLLSPAVSLDDLERRMAVLTRAHHQTPTAGARPVSEPSSGSSVTAPPQKVLTPTGSALQSLLQSGIAGLQPLEDEPLSEPAPLDVDEIVPIETLLYRGRAALLRAIQVRDEIKARGSADDSSLRELYDLLDLAKTE